MKAFNGKKGRAGVLVYESIVEKDLHIATDNPNQNIASSHNVLLVR